MIDAVISKCYRLRKLWNFQVRGLCARRTMFPIHVIIHSCRKEATKPDPGRRIVKIVGIAGSTNSSMRSSRRVDEGTG